MVKNTIFLKSQKKSVFRQICIWRISVAQMAHFAGECFLFNLHLKRMKFGLFVKPHVSKKKLIMTKSAEN